MKASDISNLRLLSLIDEYWSSDGRKPWAYQVLYAEGFPEKVVEAKYEKLSRRGWIECGVTLRTAWLTPSGKQELARLRAV